jgi:hypothetical protein
MDAMFKRIKTCMDSTVPVHMPTVVVAPAKDALQLAKVADKAVIFADDQVDEIAAAAEATKNLFFLID